jgi:6-phosphogluconolactonase
MVAVDIFENPESLLDAAAELVVRDAALSIEARDRFTLALSGGATPRGLYERLASARHRDRIQWSRMHLFWSDERCVPPSDPASNSHMAHEALIEHVSIPPGHVHRIRGENEPCAEAKRYEGVLRATLGEPGSGGGGRFDLALLGLGRDGHTASLFPAGTALRETVRWVVAERVDARRGWRITLTLPVLNAARSVVFLVTGRDKAMAVAEVLGAAQGRETRPAQLVAGRHANARWMVDRAAASLLAGDRYFFSLSRVRRS